MRRSGGKREEREREGGKEEKGGTKRERKRGIRSLKRIEGRMYLET